MGKVWHDIKERPVFTGSCIVVFHCAQIPSLVICGVFDYELDQWKKRTEGIDQWAYYGELVSSFLSI